MKIFWEIFGKYFERFFWGSFKRFFCSFERFYIIIHISSLVFPWLHMGKICLTSKNGQLMNELQTSVAHRDASHLKTIVLICFTTSKLLCCNSWQVLGYYFLWPLGLQGMQTNNSSLMEIFGSKKNASGWGGIFPPLAIIQLNLKKIIVK